ncbi:hypothetical protein BP5796_00623 [Coleophoma crateriformis]|uniref:tRNA pseudouridine(55) synthase n=1 Tax=Coleophoma crateriformis TaxID=565419 RepID=A0A3D8T8H9_9HELO|nr:hypothetical protein BP5796_00623 [Coleophoma crateriformis]
MSAKKLFWRMTQGNILEGVFAINKPTGISSAQALRDIQKQFNPSELFAPWLAAEKAKIARENHNQRQRRKQIKKGNEVKIGHGGTLDPLATGVLICGVGKGTKELQGFLECTKTYEAVILFGAATDTYDRVGKVLKRAPYEHVTQEMVEENLKQFRGKFMQLPPLYSALKMNGKPLYEYAREGKEIPREIERRPVEVLELELVEWMEGDTHEHKIPSEKAARAEINVARKVWKQVGQFKFESDKDTEAEDQDKDPLEEFNEKKRKMGEDQDDLVVERPVTKKGKELKSETEEATMSGGLAEDAEDAEASTGEATPPQKGPPAARLRMTVTSGFYVRSLCHDLGAAVKSSALMAELVRTRQGKFELGSNVLEYEDLEKGEKVWGSKVEEMIKDWNQGSRSAPIDEPAAVKKEAEVEVEAKKEQIEVQEPASAKAEDEESKKEIAAKPEEPAVVAGTA